ncbi:alpha/beta fold hydrolase [Microbispora sp. KK1-11]|uniref:alpha/beta fold hydrolase n=1 Tax=Microbispora sp. KK1-11 TaxID=2053005 RepID=UPI001157C8B4|nr:alpha/beta fold hydrolase [Microbispora sp. KK1-11]TQS29265.1 alpha/beta fold hydrolase [Microbispora sp. KK1-11]
MTIRHEERGSGEPVVLLHSSVADSGMWDPQWEPLGERFRVIRLDFRGHGRTPFAAEGPYSDAGDVADLLAALGLRRVGLVGSSYGGRVALELATGHPDLVSRLVLLNAGCGLPSTPDLEEFGGEEDRLIEAGDVGGAVDLNVRTWLGPEADEAARVRLAAMQRHAFEVQLAADPQPERRREAIDLAVVTAPTLVVTGGHDLAYFRESGRHIAEALPDATLLDLDWAGHLPSLERPAEVTRLLTEFLS